MEMEQLSNDSRSVVNEENVSFIIVELGGKKDMI